jgi:sarcosine oxidase, subunit delta
VRVRSKAKTAASMKILNCPLNGPRNISEFVWGGEVKPMPDPGAGSDRDWGAFVFLENNTAGVVREWWCHVPTSFWFIAERNTLTDEIIRTYPAGELFRERVEFAVRPKGGEGTR